jgi:glycosyltransferase involved in cell wall biosynthesis
VKISYYLVRIARNVDVVFFVGMATLLLPMLTARLLGKLIVYSGIGSITNSIEQEYKGTFFGLILTRIAAFLEGLQYKISNRAVVYSAHAVDPRFQKYRNKVLAAPRHYLNFARFKPERRLSERDNMVGYIGRFEPDKGTMNFVEAIPEILEVKGDTRFLVGGNGQLREDIEEFLKKENLSSKVKVPGWIAHDDIPKYLNELKLLVLPSYVEGLPNILLEAMACGTPVLATLVGGVPDVIKDGETGFILADNSPETIAKGVLRALGAPNLEEIGRSAYDLVSREYTYEAAVERYRGLLTGLIGADNIRSGDEP